MDPRRSIPSVDALLEAEALAELMAAYPRTRVVAALRMAVADVRRAVGEGNAPADVAEPAAYARRARSLLEAADVPSLRPVVNATGVVLHTNLGRAPLAAAAREAMARAAAGYSNLEFDLEAGVRGSRYDHCVGLLTELTGAEDALVVNNCAGALMLALNAVAQGRGVAVSRGELVEIGGGFRVPEVMARSGARLVEVGSTNRTRVRDYAEALTEQDVAAVLKVHRSNFRITGFTEEATVAELAEVARDAQVPLVYDLGSGLLLEADVLGLPHEPRAQDALAEGADIVAVSGDKLMGAPQAGILLGRSAFIGSLRKNPMTRALRVDKVTLAGLEATLRLYRDPGQALREIPTLRALAATGAELEARARAWADRLAQAGVEGVEVVATEGAVGGGTYPGVVLASWGVAVEAPEGADDLARRLRTGDPAVVGRVTDGRLHLDVRTVDPGEEDDLLRRVAEAVEA